MTVIRQDDLTRPWRERETKVMAIVCLGREIGVQLRERSGDKQAKEQAHTQA
jgi:hypothetical protein